MRFRVLTYNVLHAQGAKRLLRGRNPGAWSSDRLQRAAELVRRLEPDVACLQEVDDAAFAELERALGDDFTCAARMTNEGLPPKDGVATFVRSSRFEVASAHHLRIRDVVTKHAPQYEASRAGAGFAAAFWRELHEKLSLAVAVRLRPTEGGAPRAEVCVATTHLFFDPKYPDLKLMQAYLLQRELDDIGRGAPCILAGDLNSTPHSEDGGDLSGVYALLTKGFVPPSHPHHPVALRRSVGILTGVVPKDVPELRASVYHSAYAESLGEEPVTNISRDFRGCLDYVLYRSEPVGGRASGNSPGASLRLAGVEAVPVCEELGARSLMPSAVHPSDHFPLVADFELVSPVE